MKKNLVSAVTNYIGAWQALYKCKPGSVNGICNNDDDRVDFAAAAFKTPADVRVHKALLEAYEQGGVVPSDFPKSVRDDVFCGAAGRLASKPPASPPAARRTADETHFRFRCRHRSRQHRGRDVLLASEGGGREADPIVNSATRQGQDPWMANERTT